MSIFTTNTLLLLFYLHAAMAEFETLFSIEGFALNAEDMFSPFSIKNSTLTYKICRDDQEQINVKKCKIFQEYLDSENKQSKFCDITLNGEVNDENIRVADFGTNKAVVSWFDDAENKEYFLRYTIVHFSNCKTAEVKIGFQTSEDRFMSQTYNEDVILKRDEHTFDILFKNSRIFGEKVCKITFDDLGNQVSGPAEWFITHNNASVYINPISVNETYVATEIANITRVSLLKSDGVIKILKEVNHKHIDDATEYGSIRICYMSNQKNRFICNLFDSTGKVNYTIEVDFPDAYDIDIHNTHDGGFIIMITSKPKRFGFQFHLIKFDSNVKQLGPTEVPDFECKAATDKKWSYVFEKKLGEYCVTRACHAGQKYNVLSKCFTADDLINKKP